MGAFVFGAVLGGIAGAAYGLFTAPQAGAVTRQRLIDQARGIVQQTEQVLSALVDEGERLVESGRASIAAMTERVTKPADVPAAGPAGTDEVIASEPVPPETPAPTDEVIEGPRPAMPEPLQPSDGDVIAARDAASGDRS